MSSIITKNLIFNWLQIVQVDESDSLIPSDSICVLSESYADPIASQDLNLVLIKWMLMKFVVIRIQLTESDVISSPGFCRLVGSYKILWDPVSDWWTWTDILCFVRCKLLIKIVWGNFLITKILLFENRICTLSIGDFIIYTLNSFFFIILE